MSANKYKKKSETSSCLEIKEIHGPAHRGANGAAMPTDEDGQYGHFVFNHPERG